MSYRVWIDAPAIAETKALQAMSDNDSNGRCVSLAMILAQMIAKR